MLRWFAVALVVLGLTPAGARSVTLGPGDFVLASVSYQHVDLIKLDRATFTPTVFSSGPLLTYASHVAVDLRGRVLVTDNYAGVVVVDPVTGAQSVLASPAGTFSSLRIAYLQLRL